MREILFRGKCKDSGKWYEGYYVHLRKTTYCFKEDYDRNPDNDMHQIIFEEMMDWGLPNQHFRGDVLPETVGQYTGLTDKNGNKIFEGDIVRLYLVDGCEEGVIKFTDIRCRFMFFTKEGSYSFNKDCVFEIIGNIHDNPELLKGE